ncbi:hypothetical protein V6Z11_D06G125400 [Gossypium hirsutum]
MGSASSALALKTWRGFPFSLSLPPATFWTFPEPQTNFILFSVFRNAVVSTLFDTSHPLLPAINEINSFLFLNYKKKTSYGLDAISNCRIIKLMMTMATAMGISACGVSLQWTNPNSYSSGKGCKYAGQSVRALPIRTLTVGKKRLPGVQLLVDEYIAKLKSYCHVDDVQIRSNPKNARNVMAQVHDEDIAVINLITSNDWVVMLDERGLDLSSEQLAELLGDAGNTAASRLSFCIGGPYGHGQRVRKRANVSIKLSSMVLNHQIALVVLMEQIYRSWTILKGQKYHH